ncbi:MAG: hypothetical protein ACXV5Q_08195 [Frankiaceae bacterium]
MGTLAFLSRHARVRRRRVVGTLLALAAGITAVTACNPPQPQRVITSAYTTGYTWFDNTPPGSGEISHPVLHAKAGGTGTSANPITAAVGHSMATGRDVLDYPAGTRFYLPHVRRYFIVEDTCGDGRAPQNVACHNLANAPRGATTWIDVYVGGGPGDHAAAAAACAGKITDADKPLHKVIVNPAANYPVVAGPLFQAGRCTNLY